MYPRHSLAALAVVTALAACSTTNPNVPSNPAAERRSIEAESTAALDRLYAQVPGSREMVAKARGVLVFPKVVSAGFVVGGSHGRGELIVGGRPEGFYSTTAASVGLLAGADSKAVYILFMTDEALAKFRASDGWTAGADASISILKAGADAGIDTMTVKQPVVGYVLTNAGLMANVSIDGTKITRLMI